MLTRWYCCCYCHPCCRYVTAAVHTTCNTPHFRAGLSAKADVAAKARLSGVLCVAVKAVTVAGLLAVTFGPPYSFTLLRGVYSQRWADTEAPFVLGCYTAYLLLLAVNGEPRAFWCLCVGCHGVLVLVCGVRGGRIGRREWVCAP